METLELEPTTTKAERLLIYESKQNIDQTNQEVHARAGLLNVLLNKGLSNDDIKAITRSVQAIDDYIRDLHLNQNKELKKLIKAGIKVEAALPEELAQLSYALKAWFNYPSSGDKYSFLIFTDRWTPDTEALESFFEQRRYKFYVSGSQLQEYRTLETIANYFNSKRIPYAEISHTGHLTKRFMSGVKDNKFVIAPRPQYFMNLND